MAAAVTAVWPGYHEAAFGIAYDIGSTTVAGHLCDLHTGEVVASAGVMNPQIRFGEDLMSRVSYVMMNPGSEKELTRAIRGCLAKLTAELASDAEIERDDILEVVLVGNPVMHHLLLGIDPTELGGAPFALAVDESVRMPGRALGLPVNEGGRAYILPCIAGHVGADTAGVILSEGAVRRRRGEPHRRCRHERRDRAREPRSAPRRLEPHRACVRGGADLVRSARGARGDRARAHRSRDARAALRVIGCDHWSDDPGSPTRRSRACAGRESSRRSPSCISPV